MRIWRHYPLAAVLLLILLLPASALAGPAPECRSPESPRLAVEWDLEAPWLGISWHSSLALEEMPVAEPGHAPAVEWDQEEPGLMEAARRALKLVQRILQFHASLLELASRHLF